MPATGRGQAMTAVTATVDVGTWRSGDVGGTVPATLSLTLGPAASFGAFTPGKDQGYDASTTANVISTAGDAALAVADPSATAAGPARQRHVRAAEPLLAAGGGRCPRR